MAIKGAKTIVEYAMRKWMEHEEFSSVYFELEINGYKGTITDHNNEKLKLVYDPINKRVYLDE